MGEIQRPYVAAVEAMANAVAEWIAFHPGDPPAFALLPRDVIVIASLARVEGRVCRNRAAHEVCAAIRPAAIQANGRAPTLFMLACALEYLGIEVERVGLADLGFGGIIQ